MRVLKGFTLLVLVVGVAVLGVWRGWLSMPPQWNPWAPLDVNAPPNLLTRYKLMALRNDPQLCDQALATSGLRATRQADSSPQASCPLSNVLRVQGGEVALSSSFLASCPLAVAFALFERHALQPAALATYGQEVVQVDHLGSFACRNMYGRESGARSQHATASALDIAGFRLADGRRVNVLKDWPKDNTHAQFLRQVRDGACDVFNVVLS
ncbi:extensin family protein, partial [Pseudomonas sp. PICF6]|uniref:extensin-like domain-containing protein n=1 Tax=Pseudomonas sp. PICF6 TaxID=2664172 RepID=UPI0013685B36|nr:extensin [Pseudomonas sp. PICF6]